MIYNSIILGDCIEIMQKDILSESIDLIYADPPYNLSGKELNLINNTTGGPFKKMNQDWDIWDYDEYYQFTNNWIKLCYEKLRLGGSLYVSCTYHNIAEVIINAKKIGFKLNNIITWVKSNAMPNITKRTFKHSTEYVCWFVKGNKWKFNYEKLKEMNLKKTKKGENKQMSDFIDFIELPIVQGRERIKDDFGKTLHPTQKPEKLLEIIIIASTDENDIILDPFFGTGTTGIVAQRLNRKWIGIEKDKVYYEAAKKRLNNFIEGE